MPRCNKTTLRTAAVGAQRAFLGNAVNVGGMYPHGIVVVCADVQPFPEKIALAQYAQGRFLLRYDRKLNLTFPVIKHFVSRVSLREARLLIARATVFLRSPRVERNFWSRSRA